MIGKIRYYADLIDCSARLIAAMATRNDLALWNVFCDVEDVHRRVGHEWSHYDRAHPWSEVEDDAQR